MALNLKNLSSEGERPYQPKASIKGQELTRVHRGLRFIQKLFAPAVTLLCDCCLEHFAPRKYTLLCLTKLNVSSTPMIKILYLKQSVLDTLFEILTFYVKFEKYHSISQ